MCMPVSMALELRISGQSMSRSMSRRRSVVRASGVPCIAHCSSCWPCRVSASLCWHYVTQSRQCRFA